MELGGVVLGGEEPPIELCGCRTGCRVGWCWA